jgi:hypothetical protein
MLEDGRHWNSQSSQPQVLSDSTFEDRFSITTIQADGSGESSSVGKDTSKLEALPPGLHHDNDTEL